MIVWRARTTSVCVFTTNKQHVPLFLYSSSGGDGGGGVEKGLGGGGWSTCKSVNWWKRGGNGKTNKISLPLPPPQKKKTPLKTPTLYKVKPNPKFHSSFLVPCPPIFAHILFIILFTIFFFQFVFDQGHSIYITMTTFLSWNRIIVFVSIIQKTAVLWNHIFVWNHIFFIIIIVISCSIFLICF